MVDAAVDEASPSGRGFLAEMAQAWEEEAVKEALIKSLYAI